MIKIYINYSGAKSEIILSEKRVVKYMKSLLKIYLTTNLLDSKKYLIIKYEKL